MHHGWQQRFAVRRILQVRDLRCISTAPVKQVAWRSGITILTAVGQPLIIGISDMVFLKRASDITVTSPAMWNLPFDVKGRDDVSLHWRYLSTKFLRRSKIVRSSPVRSTPPSLSNSWAFPELEAVQPLMVQVTVSHSKSLRWEAVCKMLLTLRCATLPDAGGVLTRPGLPGGWLTNQKTAGPQAKVSWRLVPPPASTWPALVHLRRITTLSAQVDFCHSSSVPLTWKCSGWGHKWKSLCMNESQSPGAQQLPLYQNSWILQGEHWSKQRCRILGGGGGSRAEFWRQTDSVPISCLQEAGRWAVTN
jgi:hypothetical protein